MVNSNSKTTLIFENIKISDIEERKNFFIKGSESFIYEGTFAKKKVLIKIRQPKKYRDQTLDYELRLQRLRIESRMIKSALNNGIHCPSLLSIDLNSFSMQLGKIEGKNFGIMLSELSNHENDKESLVYFEEFGSIVGKLHNIEIIHGDLTPLNIIVDNDKIIYIIDFGLSYYSSEVKDKAMDLFILFGALKIYPQQIDQLFHSFLLGYRTSADYDSVIDYFNKLTKKGRYKS